MALSDQQFNKLNNGFNEMFAAIKELNVRMENLERVIEKSDLDRSRPREEEV